MSIGTFEIRLQWISKTAGGYAGVTLGFSFMLILAFFDGLVYDPNVPAIFNIFFILLMMPCMIGALIYAYATVVHLFNKTIIYVNGDNVSIRTGPFWWKKVPTVVTLRPRRCVLREWLWRSDMGGLSFYRPELIGDNNEAIRLTASFTDLKKAQMIVDTVRKELNLSSDDDPDAQSDAEHES